MGAATQVFHTGFDRDYLRLPPAVQQRLQRRMDEIGAKLSAYPHQRLVGSERFRARVGDYRIIYTFNLAEEEIHFLAVGHRREIYR